MDILCINYPLIIQSFIADNNKTTHLTVTLSSVLRLNLIIPSQSRKSLESTNPTLGTQQRYLKLISTSYLIFQDCHSEQPPQTTQVSSALELTLLISEVIFVTIFGMAGMNLGTNVSVATRSASMFKSWNNVMTTHTWVKNTWMIDRNHQDRRVEELQCSYNFNIC
ncbi:Hypothetical_protein [Hexamita inflata]|uniref:Hypothetical_protein n=1 Tax=Hexamita inflata TaxID=28002 RepID=A0ABP1HMI1_9EUKA